METMEVSNSKSELEKGYQRVPWSSWDQWNFVRTNIFSSSPHDKAAALTKISGWRSRGCLPVQIDVTACFVEIQLSDPFFRKERTDGALESEEMLAMLYSMAIIRLVNCFLEATHKKTGVSISQLAEQVGVPRILIDIRHESSHRDLPSIQLVRSASVKALDWLKEKYWEPQRKTISDVRVEIRSRLSELTCFLRTKKARNTSSDARRKGVRQTAILSISNKLSSQICAKLNSSKFTGSKKQVSKMVNIISRLYSSYPSEVVSVFLEFFRLQAHDFSNSNDMENSDDSDGEPVSAAGSSSELKTIISELSTKRPHLICSILKSVLETIEVCINKIGDGQNDTLSIDNQFDKLHKRDFSAIVYWLIMSLKRLKDAGRLELVDKAEISLLEKTAIPRAVLANMLQKCLALAVVEDKHLLDSVLLLAEMMSNGSLKAKLLKLPLFCQKDWSNNGDVIFPVTESILSLEEGFVSKEANAVEKLRLQLNNRSRKGTSVEDDSGNTNNPWVVTKSWIPCPIGMIPCSLNSTAVLPVLGNVKEGSKTNIEACEVENDCQDVDEGPFDFPPELSDDESCHKRLKLSIDEEKVDYHNRPSPMEDLLLINGVWKKLGEEEFLKIQSDIRSFSN